MEYKDILTELTNLFTSIRSQKYISFTFINNNMFTLKKFLNKSLYDSQQIVDTDDNKLLVYYGIICEAKKSYNNMEKYYMTGINRNDTNCMFCYAWFFQKNGQVNLKTEIYYKMYIEVGPRYNTDYGDVYNNLGNYYMNNKQYDLMLEYYDLAKGRNYIYAYENYQIYYTHYEKNILAALENLKEGYLHYKEYYEDLLFKFYVTHHESFYDKIILEMLVFGCNSDHQNIINYSIEILFKKNFGMIDIYKVMYGSKYNKKFCVNLNNIQLKHTIFKFTNIIPKNNIIENYDTFLNLVTLRGKLIVPYCIILKIASHLFD